MNSNYKGALPKQRARTAQNIYKSVIIVILYTVY